MGREWGGEFGLAEDGKSSGIQVFGGAGSKKIRVYYFFLGEMSITSNSKVHKAGHAQSRLMLFKMHCFLLAIAWLFFYRNALTGYCSNFPDRPDSPSLPRRL